MTWSSFFPAYKIHLVSDLAFYLVHIRSVLYTYYICACFTHNNLTEAFLDFDITDMKWKVLECSPCSFMFLILILRWSYDPSCTRHVLSHDAGH